MRRLLFALSFAARPSFVVGVGTYVGYTFSWIVRNRSDSKAGPFCDKAIGIDIDTKANKLARRNSASLGHGERLEFLDGDAVSILSELNLPIDLLYIDLDHPATGKRAYPEVLEVAVSKLRSGALVLAHDACVRKFRQDFDRYHNYVRASGLFPVSCVLPVDNCGLSVAAMR
jgi:predicted O-methyltransferase YrrM